MGKIWGRRLGALVIGIVLAVPVAWAAPIEVAAAPAAPEAPQAPEAPEAPSEPEADGPEGDEPPEPGPALYDETVLDDEPLAYYRFDDSGSSAADASGNGRTGVYAGSAVTGEPGVLIDDTSEAARSTVSGTPVMTASDTGLPSGSSARTLEVWAKSDAVNRSVIGYGNTSIFLTATYRIRVHIDGARYQDFDTPFTRTTEDWHHYAMTVDGSGGFTIYGDGRPIGSGSLPAGWTSLSGTLAVGDGIGTYDEAAVYDRALSADEVAEHYFRGQSRLAEDPCTEEMDGLMPEGLALDGAYAQAVMADEPLGYWPIGEAPWTEGERIAYDHSGNCRHLPMNSAYEVGDAAIPGGAHGLEAPSSNPDDWALNTSSGTFPADTSAVTIEFWEKAGTTPTGRFLFQYGYWFGAKWQVPSEAKLRVYKNSYGDFQDFWAPIALDDGAWHHYAFSLSGTDLTIFVDGVRIGTMGGVSTRPWANTAFSNTGAIDELAIYPAALDSTQIAKHVGAGRADLAGACPVADSWGYSGRVLEDEPVAYFRAGERSVDANAQLAMDSSGNCHHGAITSAASGTSGAIAGSPNGALESGGAWAMSTTTDWTNQSAPRPLSVEMWKKQSTDDGWVMRYGSTFSLRVIGGGEGKLRLYSRDEGEYRDLWAPHALNDGKWHHYVVTYDGDTTKLYVDGSYLGTGYNVQWRPWGVAQFSYQGAGDEAAIYPTVLDNAAITEHWAAGRAELTGECPVAPTSGYSGTVLDDDPIAYYPAGERAADGDAQVAVDRSGNCHHGAYATASTGTSGAIAGSVDGAVQSAGLWALSTTTEWTNQGAPRPLSVEMWKKQSTDDGWVMRYGSTFSLRVIGGGEGKLRLYSRDEGEYRDLWAPHALNDGKWHHYVVTYDGDTTKLYVDGSYLGTGYNVQWRPWGVAQFNYQGAGDEAAIYPTVLDNAAITEHWAAGRAELTGECPVAPSSGYSGTVLDDEPVAYFRAGEQSVDAGAQVAIDSSGNCHHGAYATASTGTSGAILGSTNGGTGSTGTWALSTTTEWTNQGAARPLSVEMWKKQSANDAWVMRYGSTFSLRVLIGSEGKLRLYSRDEGDYRDLWAPFPLNDDEWHHYLVTYDGDTTRLYVDGIYLGTGYNVQWRPWGVAQFNHTGSADEIAIYPTALTGDDARRHFSIGRSAGNDACRSGSLSGHAQAVLDDEPVQYWRLGDAGEAGEGQVAFDSSEHCRNGAYNSTVTTGSGALAGDDDGAMETGSTDVWDAASHAGGLPYGSQPGTVEFWADTTNVGRWLFTYGYRTGIYLNSTSSARVYRSNNDYTSVGYSELEPGWHHWALTYDGTNQRLYIDGDLKWTSWSVAQGWEDGPFHFGHAAGAYDELAIFDRALSGAEIAQRVEDGHKIDTTTSVTGPDGTWYSEHDLDFEVTVTSGDDGDAPEGTVSLWDGATQIGEAVLDPDGTAAITVTLAGGDRELTARYAGSDDHIASTSAPISAEVEEGYATATSVEIAPEPAKTGQAALAVVTVDEVEEHAGDPEGDVEVEVGGDTYLGELVVGPEGSQATIALPALPVGEHEVTARYLGLGEHRGSETAEPVTHVVERGDVDITVDLPATVGFSAPATISIDVDAQAPAAGEAHGTVEVFVDDDPIGSATLTSGHTTKALPTNLDPGPHTVSVSYEGSSQFETGTAEAETTIEPAEAAVALSANPSPSAIGAAFEVSASLSPVSPATATPSGIVDFTVDGELVGDDTAEDGVATITVDQDLDLGEHELVATLRPSARWAAASGSRAHQVRNGATASLSLTPSSVVAGQRPTGVVVVTSASPSAPAPQGTVTVVDEDGDEVGSASLDAAGRAELLLTALPVGSHTLRARYGGDAGQVPTTSPNRSLTVAKATPSVSVIAEPEPAGVDDPVILIATLKAVAPGAGIPSGFVTFFAEGSEDPLATAAVSGAGQASAEVSFDEAGTTRITAVYGGDGSFVDRTSAPKTHRTAPATHTELDADPASAPFGQAVELTATVTSSAGTPAGTVTFLDGTRVVGTAGLVSGVATLTTASLPAGEHDLTARYRDDDWGPSSGATEVSIGAAETAVDLVVAPSTTRYGQSATATATIDVPGIEDPVFAGLVAFEIGGTFAGSAPVGTTGVAAISLPGIDPGTYEVTAAYSGHPDGSLAPSDDAVDHEIIKAEATIAVVAPPAPVAVDAEVEIAATVARATAGSGTRPGGTVSFYADGTTLLGSAPVVDGKAVLTTEALDEVRDWAVTAEYSGDDRYEDAVSTAVDWTVLDGVEIEVTPPSSATAFGADAPFSVTVSPLGVGDEPTGTVALIHGTKVLGTAVLIDGEAVLETDRLRAGTSNVRVRYSGDAAYAAAISGLVPHEVERSAATITMRATPAPAQEDEFVTVIARVEGAAAHVARPTGTVTFDLPSGPSQQASLDGNGEARIRTRDLTIGTHEITASYGGDANHLAAADPASINVVVVEAIDAGMSIEPSAGTAPMTVTGSGVVTGSPSGIDLLWDFGDGDGDEGSTFEHTYTAAGIYTITLRATDGEVSTYVTSRVRVGATAPLQARAGSDQEVAHGEDALFDGRSSTPSLGIDSWRWDFGDGATSNLPSATHRYERPGTYVARLTVTRGTAKTTDEMTVKVTDPAEDEGLRVTVLGDDGPLEGAEVVVIDSGWGEFRGATDADGEAVLAGLADATVKVYAIADGYRPKMGEVTLVHSHGTVELTLERGERGVSQVSARELTAQEATDAGVDLADPANNHVYQFEIWLGFETDPEPRTYVVNEAGQVVVQPTGTSSACEGDTCTVQTSGGKATGTVRMVNDKPTITWLVMPGQAQWMKEFFEVEMVVQNLTDSDFAFEDGAATLDLPAGLSLASLTTPQEAVKELDDIMGGTSGSAKWIVRGDHEGAYRIRADYTASLYPLGTSVHLESETQEDLVVHGPGSMSLEVVADDEAIQFSPYLVDVIITNDADVPAHNVSLDLFDQGTVGFIYQPKQKHRVTAASLAPGASLTASAVLVPHGSGDLNLEESFVKHVGGTETKPGTITSRDAKDERPHFCGGGKDVDQEGVCLVGDQPFGEMQFSWDATGGKYRIYRTMNPTTPFRTDFIAETTDTSYLYETVPGDGGFFAVTTVAADGSEEMLHNAVAAQAGRAPTATAKAKVVCASGHPPKLELEFSDRYYELDEWRIATGMDPDTGQPIGNYGGGSLSGLEDTATWDSAGNAIWEGSESKPLPSHITHIPDKEGSKTHLVAATILVVVRNGHDQGYWSDPEPVVVFDQCTDDIPGIPAEQTFGNGCEGEEYFALNGRKDANPSRCMADPVNSATGSLTVAAGDLALPGPGGGLSLTRAYNSADDAVGVLGRGWTHSYASTLTFPDDGVIVLRRGDGQQIVFYEDEEDPRPGDWFISGTSSLEVKKVPPTTSECAGCDYILREPGQQFSDFDDDGTLMRRHDRNGNGLTFARDGSGRPLTATDEAGKVTTFAYDGDRLDRVTLPDGRYVDYGYTGGLLTSVRNVEGGITEYRYEDDLLVEETDPRDHRVHLTTYDETTGRAVRQEDALGGVTTWTWDEETETSVMTDSEGGVWTDVYQENVLQSATDPLGRTVSYAYDAKFNVIATTDPMGGTVTQSYDDRGNVLQTTGPAPLFQTDRYTYDALDNRTSWITPNGDTIDYSFDTLGRPTGVTGPGDRQATSEYDSEGNLRASWDGRGRDPLDLAAHRSTYEYDASGNRTSSCSILGHCTTREFDASGRLTDVVGPNGNAPGGNPAEHTVSFTYDDGDRRKTETDPLGNTTTYTYDANGNVTQVEGADGSTTVNVYDAANQLVSSSIEGAPPTTYDYDSRGNVVEQVSPEGRTTTWEYDLAGQMTAMVDGEGGRWTYTHDRIGRVVSTTDPLHRTTSIEFDAGGRAVAQVDALGRRSTSTYDQMNNALSVTDPTGVTARTTYLPDGQIDTQTDGAGGVTRFEYDTNGRLVGTTAPNGSKSKVILDEDGRTIATVDPRGLEPGAVEEDYTTHLELDAAGNVIETTDALDNTTTFEVDALGRVTSTTDPDGRTTAVGYDEVGRQESITTPDEQTTTWEYDTSGDLVRRAEPDGNATTYEYDDDHLATSKTDPLGRVWSSTYDGNGQIETTTDPITRAAGPGVTTTSHYDAAGQLTGLDYTDPDTADVDYSYDAAGRLKTMSDGEGIQSYGYDAAGRLTSTSRGGDTFRYQFDGAGRLTETTYPDGSKIATSYDRNGQISSVGDGDGDQTATFGYDAAGGLVSSTMPNGVEQAITRDRLGRLSESHTTRGPTEVTFQTREYDDVGNVTVETGPDGEVSYEHDGRDRLTETCFDGCDPEVPSVAYQYDDAGNRIRTERDDAAPTESAYDDADQERQHAEVGRDAVAVVHDLNGNVIDDGRRTYTYDAAGNLIEVGVSAGLTAGGSLSGTVTDADDEPLEGIVVHAYGAGRQVAQTETAADGTYSFPHLPARSYDVFFDDLGTGAHRSQWFGGATSPGGSEPVEIVADGAATADATLADGGPTQEIHGTVTDDEGAPIAGAEVTVRSIASGWFQNRVIPFEHPRNLRRASRSVLLEPTFNGIAAPQGHLPAVVPVEAGEDLVVGVKLTNVGLADQTDIEVSLGSAAVTCAADDGDGTIEVIESGDAVLCTATVEAGEGRQSVTGEFETGEGAQGMGDFWYFGMGECTITGTEGDDVLTGTAGDDVICGLGGDDEIDAGDGDDVIRPGNGADEVDGGSGDDTIVDTIEAVGDVIDSGPGNDTVWGAGGDDTILGTSGADVLRGGAGDDTVTGGDDGSIIYGDEGANTLQGGDGFDVVRSTGNGGTVRGGGSTDYVASAGDDLVEGGDGDDIVMRDVTGSGVSKGGPGDDQVLGGSGDDELWGGPGTDALLGAGGGDTFPDAEAGLDSVLQDTVELSVTAAEDGTWSMTIPKGVYHTSFAAQGYFGEWYDGQDQFFNARMWSTTDVAVGYLLSQDATLIRDPDQELPDAEPEPVGAIEGTVLDADGEPIEGVTVHVYGGGREVASVDTAADGTYEVNGLTPTAYDVYFDDLDTGTHVSEWYGGATSPGGSTPVEVVVGERSTVDATLEAQGPTVEIGGRVTDDDGDPIAGAQVTTRSIASGWIANLVAPFEHPLDLQRPTSSISPLVFIDGKQLPQGHLPTAVPVESGEDVQVDVRLENVGQEPQHDVEVTLGTADVLCFADDQDGTIGTISPGESVVCRAVIEAEEGMHSIHAQFSTSEGMSSSGDVQLFGLGECTITGTDGNDVLTGTPGDDVICGLAGEDVIDGGAGDDVIRPSYGEDVVDAGEGDDVVFDIYENLGDIIDSGPGNDLVWADGGNDVITGTSGADVLVGGPGNDTITGGDDGSIIYGGAGANTLQGGDGPDVIRSHGGGGTVRGGGSMDYIVSAGDDLLDGEGGDDVVMRDVTGDGVTKGGPGQDTVLGGSGADELWGGDGADVLLGAGGTDTFPDREAGDSVAQDTVELSVTTAADGTWSMRVPKGTYHTSFAAQGYFGEWFDGAEHFPNAVMHSTSGGPFGSLTVLDATLVRDESQELPDPQPEPEPEPEPEAPSLGEPGEVLATYGYGGDGLRLWQRSGGDAAPDSAVTRFAWDASAGLPQPSMISGAEQGGGSTRVVFGPSGPIWVDPSAGVRVFIHTDAIGSIVAATDQNGDVTTTTSYTPFGETKHTTGDYPIQAYAGQQFDEDTGLYYLRARYYDPATGRFTQPDPAGWAPGAGHESTYLYAGGSPLTNVDPTGLRLEQAEAAAARAKAMKSANDPLGMFKDWISNPHNFLEVAGFFPGPIGMAADGANAILYAFEGDLANATLSMVAFAPIAGDAVAAGFRYADEGIAAARGLSRYGDNLDDIARFADDLGSGLHKVDGFADEGIDLVTHSDGAAESVVKSLDEAPSCPIGGAMSFSGETLVLMADGTRKPIQDIEVGDRVMATDPETGRTVGREVTHLWVHGDTLLDLEVDGELITTTEDHPFWNETDQEWQRADQLDPGDLVRDADGDLLEVDGIDWDSAHIAMAFNLTVDDLHTYYVAAGDDFVLVHNTGCNNALRGAKRGPKPKGEGPHNLKIEEIAGSITDGKVIAGGQGDLAEAVIPTPGGIKGSRRPDILVQRHDGSIYGINVGRQSRRTGAPVKREVEALHDLEWYADLEMHFVAYD